MEEQKYLRKKRKALSEGNKTLLATMCINLAELYMQQGHYDSAVDEYTVVADAYESLGMKIDYARANRMIGEAYMQLREFDKALSHQKIHLDVSRELNNKLEEQRALATIGHTHLTYFLDVVDNPDKSRLKLAHKAFMKSLNVCESLTGINKQEHLDMSARLYANIGVVHECLGEYEKAIELIRKSINICKQNDLYEQLERGYASLGSLYMRRQEYNSAINQYNLAMEVAGRLPNKANLICSSLATKAEILIRLADFRGAKGVLLKAHKLKTSNLTERENIKTLLKTVAAMCYKEESLITMADGDHKSKKELYEKLGDGACFLKNYTKAIEYYQKMLQEAKQNGEVGKDLSPCYVSLAQTYSDNKQYGLALDYFQKELALWKNDLKESIRTFFNIIDIMELAEKSVIEIKKLYLKIRKQCQQAGEKQLEGSILKKYGDFLRKHEELQEALEVERELVRIGFAPTDQDSEGSEENNTPNIGDDIDTDDITDLSDNSDTEHDLGKVRATRKRAKGFVIKKNMKGETQLHTACINGKVEVVRHLLDQGHPVNIRDNCGWLPLHEAAIYGYVEIVKMLLNKGAAINDRGGTGCNGITPLHDAASNGHLEVIELLLDRGASPIVKTDDGETPLHILKNWRSDHHLDEINNALYTDLVQRMTAALEKSGHSTDPVLINNKNNALIYKNYSPTKTCGSRRQSKEGSATPLLKSSEKKSKRAKPKKTTPVKTQIGNARRNIDFDDEFDLSSSFLHPDLSRTHEETNNASLEYKKVMLSLRHSSDSQAEMLKKRKSNELVKQPALLPAEEVDDWLEDDLNINSTKKRKPNLAENFLYTSNTRNPNASGKQNESRSFGRNFSANDFNYFEICNSENEETNLPAEIDIDDFNYDGSTSDSSRGSFGSVRRKRKTQISLIDAGFSRTKTSPIKFSSTKTHHSIKQQKAKSSQSGSLNMFHEISAQPIIESVLSADVRIDGKLYRVPMTATEMHTCTIKWLAEEASKRYFKREGIKPVLELETKNGAILAEDDLVSMLFSSGSNQAEELQAKVIKRNLAPLSDRYEEACINLNLASSKTLKDVLSEVSTVLDLSDLVLSTQEMLPLCKAINRQNNLYEINFAGNLMTDECMLMLCSSLTSISSLSKLNLSLNHFSAESLKYLADTFRNSDAVILEHLAYLDLSYNPLCDDCLPYLAIITRYLKLKVLNLADVCFTKDILTCFNNKNVDLYLEHIESLDISYNDLDIDEITKFVSWLNPSNLKMLNLSNNAVSQEGVLTALVEILQKNGEIKINLKELQLSKCHITDYEVYNLLSVLTTAKDFEYLNLSHNGKLTAVTLRRLLHHTSSLKKVDLYGCDNILKHFQYNNEQMAHLNTNIRTLTLSHHEENHREARVLTSMWEMKYNCITTKEFKNFIKLSVPE